MSLDLRVKTRLEKLETGTGRRLPPWWQIALAGMALFLLAFGQRLIGLEQHLIADDQYWVRRAARFSLALQQGNLRGTYQVYHPGVPILWIASLAIGPARSAELAAVAGDLSVLEKAPSYLEALFDARRGMALTSAALSLLLVWLTWRLFGTGPALLAGLLLASEPFLVAQGRLLHLDLLLSKLMGVSVLAALTHLDGHGGRGYLVTSGLAAGLALLTKAPGILLYGFIPLLALAWTWWRHGRLALADLLRLAPQIALWGIAACACYVLLWPALWVDPLGTLTRMLQGVRTIGGSPHIWGNFFMGQAVRGDAGPLYYPVSTLLRLSPITLAGLLLLAWFATRRPSPMWLPRALALLAYVLLFALLMTLSPKKMDRYLLPVFPVLVILGSLGLWSALRLGMRAAGVTRQAAEVCPEASAVISRPTPHRLTPAAHRLAPAAYLLALGLGQTALVASVQPYPLSFYNPLLGGAGLARQTILVGWGEGTDQVAAYLDRLPNASEVVVTSLYHDLLHAQFRGTGVPLWEWQRADYLADYVNMDQRGLVPAPLKPLVRDHTPVFVARINGLDYARVYRIPPELKPPGDR